MRGALRAAAFAAVCAGALAASAGPPDELGDEMKYLHAEVYDFTPERRAAWEAGRLVSNAIWVNLGSITAAEFEAAERAQLTLALRPWLSLRGELRNDRDRQGSVQRLRLDGLAEVKPGLLLGLSGSPAARRQSWTLGGTVGLASADRRRYLLVRAVAAPIASADLGPGGGALRPARVEVEGRWAAGALSVYGALDVAWPGDLAAASAEPRPARAQGQLHARWVSPAVELAGRIEVVRLGDPSFGRTPRRSLTRARTLTSATAQALLPIGGPAGWDLRLRLAARLAIERARWSDAAGAGHEAHARLDDFARTEPGARAALWLRRGVHDLELGYGAALPAQRFSRAGAASSRLQDKVYGWWDLSLSPRFHLRALLAWEIANARFGGGNGALLAFF